MLGRYILALAILAAVSAESKVDSMLTSTEEAIERGPVVVDAILREGQTLNNKFSKQVVSDLVYKIRQFKEALKRCEEDATNPNNSLFILQNFTNLLKITYETFQSMASTNFTEGIVAVQQSVSRIKREIEQSKEYRPLKINFSN